MEPQRVIQENTNIPEYAKPYAQQLLGSVFGGQDPTTGQFMPGLVGQGYQPYGRQRTAGFSPMQQQAFEGFAGMQVSPELREAAGLAGLAGRQAGQLGMSYQPMQYQPTNVSYMGTQAPQLQQYQMGPAERVGAERFGSQAMQDYMSPYMSGVVEQQKRGAIQDYRRQMPNIGAAAARMGGRGGTREALMRSEAQRNLQGQLQGIEATGLQNAFQQAQQQFGADRAAQMQAALANQQASLTTGQQNLAAQLGTQQFGAGQSLQAQQINQAMRQAGSQMGLQAALANQQAGLTTGQQNLAAQLGIQQLGAGQGLQAQQLNQAAQLQAQQQALGQNQTAQQLMEQSRQFGANLGLQGLQQQLAAAGALGGLGMQGYQQRMGIGQAQLGAGGQMQALEQELLNQQYQDFVNQQQFPYKQAEFGMGILRGIPATGATQTLYQQSPSMLNSILGAGVMGMGSLFGGLGGSGGVR